MANGAPGGALREAAKWAAEQWIWRSTDWRMARDKRLEFKRARPLRVSCTNIMNSEADWRRAIHLLRSVNLPLHHDRPKNWDSLAALFFILENLGRRGAVLDAGCARYSMLLPWLRLYGFTDLFGMNLEWTEERSHGPVRFLPGDITKTTFPDGRFDAIACLSVIEHGVPIPEFLAEAARLLKPDGVLFISTDYDKEPPDTTGKFAYGQPVHIFGPDEMREIAEQAKAAGFRLIGPLRLEHEERPVHWRRLGLDYTFISLGLRKENPNRKDPLSFF